MGYLENNADFAIELGELEDLLSEKDEHATEVKALMYNCAVCLAAVETPRRLRVASGQELSADKKLARRIYHVEFQALLWWKNFVTPISRRITADDVNVKITNVERRYGATVLWDELVADRIGTINYRVGRLAAAAVLHGKRQWGNQVIMRFRWEREQLAAILESQGIEDESA